MRDSLRWGFNRVEKALDQDQKKLRIRVLSRRVEKGGRVGEGLLVFMPSAASLGTPDTGIIISGVIGLVREVTVHSPANTLPSLLDR
jgi:hypothetical protein